MPFLRVLRDKRGYETTFLMHWFREGQRQRSRVLYVFRTPPAIRVGRQIFEPDTMREIEQQHPNIEFDWRSLHDNQQIVDAAPPEQRWPRKRKRTDEGAVAQPAPRRAPPGAAAGEAASDETAAAEIVDAAPAAPRTPRVTIPDAIEGATPEEQIAWLRTWYPIIRERVPHRTHDTARREALYALADRLNPESWAGEDAIAQGLRDAAEGLTRLSRVFATRRRRPRRASPRRDGAASGGDGGSGASGGDAS